MSRRDPVLRRLDRLLAATRRRVAVLGTLQVLAGGLLLVSFAALAAGLPRAAAPWWTVVVLAAAAAALVLLAAERLAAPLRELGDRRRFTGRLDAAAGQRNLLVAAEEAARAPWRWEGDGIASILTARLRRDAAPRLARLDVVAALRLPAVAPALGAAAAVAALALLPWLLTGDLASRGAGRLAAPLDREVLTPSVGLYLVAGPEEAVAGEAVTLAAMDFGTPRGPVLCEVRSPHGGWRALAAEAVPAPVPSPARRYTARLDEVTEDVVYRFRRDGMVTHTAQIRVLHPPLLTGLTLAVDPPAYTGLPARELDPCPAAIAAPAGSRLRWRGRTNHPVTAAGFAVAEGGTLAWTVDGARVSGETTLRGDLRGRVVLSDARGLSGRHHVGLRVDAVSDAPPTVRLSRRGDDGRLPPDGRVRLDLVAEDDYGLGRAMLLARRESGWNAARDTAWTRLPVVCDDTVRGHEMEGADARLAATLTGGDPAGPRLEAVLDLDAGGLDLLPGDVLVLAAEAADNRVPGPAARGRSRLVRLTVPTAEDLLAEQMEGADDRRRDLGDLRRRGEEVSRDLDRLKRELQKDPELDFARRQELEEAVERQEELHRELERVARDLRRDMDTLAERNLASPELVAKMDRVGELLDEVQDEELARLQQQLREAAAELSEREIREAMQQVVEEQQEYLERLDRTIALLEDLRREQELAGMVAEVEEMMRTQEELLAETAADSAAAAARQEALAEELADLRERMAEAAEKLARESAEAEGDDSPAAEMMREALEQALEAMRERDPEQAMREAAEGLRGEPGEESSSGDQQHESLRRLASLYHVLAQAQQDMQMAMRQRSAEGLLRLAHDLIELSRRQEELAVRIPEEMRDVRAPALTREQKRLLRATAALRDRLSEILAESPLLSSRLMRSLDQVLEHQDRVVLQLHDGWGGPAGTEARRGLAAVNRLVVSLLTSAQTSGGGGGSCPMPSLGSDLERMAREQAGLNRLGQELRGRQQGRGLSQESRARMERLQADQQGLAGSLQETAERERESPDAERLLGDLEELAREMERVADSLAAGEMDEEVLRRQERILSRLLDARNSVRRRGYDRRRESLAADAIFRAQRGDDPNDAALDDRRPFRLRREQVEHVPPDYRDLVRRYFRVLPRLEGEGSGP